MSGGRGGRGASPRVQAALGWGTVGQTAQRTEIAPCQLCGAVLRFTTGEYGQTLEICTNDTCFGRRPHRPTPDLTSNARKRWEKL